MRSDLYPSKAIFVRISQWISQGMSYIHPRRYSQGFAIQFQKVSIQGYVLKDLLLNATRDELYLPKAIKEFIIEVKQKWSISSPGNILEDVALNLI